MTDYDYDVLGNLVQTTLPNGVVETREYDELYRLIGVDNTDESGNVISGYDYELDAVGNRTLVEELGGRTVAYEYDKLYRLLTEDITDPTNGNQTLSYVYDAVGNRLSLTDSVNGVTTYTYNDNDWLLSETSAGVTTNYTYDNNGNNLTKISSNEQITYSWNQENRLVAAEITNGLGTTNLEYQYDANGVRVASTVNGVETRYLVDANREHAEVIEEYKPHGTTNVAYVHGLNMISAERGGEIDYYVHDGHSGVRQLTDENGVVTDSYDYDGYGNLLNSIGDTENNYLYRGEQFDQELDMQYLRQRYYDTSVGRFASVDPFSGLVELPMSRHRYMYGNANPIAYLDPSGEFSITQVLAGSLIAGILGSLNQISYSYAVAGNSFNFNGGISWEGQIVTFPAFGPSASVGQLWADAPIDFGIGFTVSWLREVESSPVNNKKIVDAGVILLGVEASLGFSFSGSLNIPYISIGGFSVETPGVLGLKTNRLGGFYSMGNIGGSYAGLGYSETPFNLGFGVGSAGGTNISTELFGAGISLSSGISLPFFDGQIVNA